MSEIGLYRYKTSVVNEKEVAFYQNGIQVSTATIQEIEYCEGDKKIKFLDSKGYYRFFTFDKHFEENDKPNLIGTTDKFLTDIYTDKANSQVVGYKTDRTISMSRIVSDEQLQLLTDVYISPRIYLYIGSNNSDLESDWLEVQLVGGDTVVTRRRNKNSKITLVIKLPEIFSQKMV